MNYLDNIFLILNIVIIVWLTSKLLKVNPKIKYKTKFNNPINMFFVFAFLLSIIPIFFSKSIFDILRASLISLILLVYLLISDGIGEEYICYNGSITSYDDIESYDYKKENNSIILYFSYKDKKDRSYLIELFFNKNIEDIEKLVKQKLLNKYKRIKKK